MDHNGFYPDLDSLNSLTSIATSGTNFNDTSCPTLPSLNNFKYQQSTSNIYQQQAIPDLNHTTSTPHHTTKPTSSLPQTQININNCNNNIFFPHDDGLFDATAATCASVPQNTGNIPSNINSSNNHHHQHQKNNFIGYVRKETGPSVVGGGGGDSNITYNINNINTNIVNNINNPANLVNSGDIFGSNQYHQINKNGETIINFTNNNLNSTTSMPTDTVTATSQNFHYGYQATNLNTNNTNNSNNNNIINNSSQGQNTIYESVVHSQTQSSSSSSSSSILDPNHMGTSKSMGTTNVINVGSNSSGLYHGHTHHQSLNNGGAYMPSTGNTIITDPHSSIDLFADYSESMSAAKIINNFESKNPLKYPSATTNRPSGTYYKSTPDYPSSQYPLNHLQPHGTNNIHIYQPTPSVNGIPSKISSNPQHAYELYGRIPHQSVRNPMPHYPSQAPYGGPLDDSLLHNSGRMNYPTRSHPSYQHPLPPHPVPPNNYGNYYNSNYNHPAIPPYSTYPSTPQMPPYASGPTIRNDTCSKSSSNFSKTGAMALSPVEHGTFSLPPQHGTTPTYATTKKDFYTENPFYQHQYHHHDDPMSRTMNSCAKKATSGHKLSNDIYNQNGMNGSSIYGLPHHQQNGNMMRNSSYQPIPPPSKHYGTSSGYPMPPTDSLSSCDYQPCGYRYKNGEMPSKLPPKNPLLNAKQFKTYNHFEPLHPPSHYGPPQYPHPSMPMPPPSMKHPEKIKFSIDLEEQINSSKIPKIRDTNPYYDLHYQHPAYYPYHRASRNNVIIDQNDSDKIPNINLSLRDFLSTWNEIDDEDIDGRPQNVSMIEDMERTIMREYNPMFVQKATDNIISATTDVPTSDKSHLELENGAICEGTEKLYVLETIDVPISELNKYKHLSIINKLPENVVITDKELFTDMEMNREKLYKSEFELEFEACQEHNKKVDDIQDIPMVEIKTESDEEAEKLATAAKIEPKTTVTVKQEGQNNEEAQPISQQSEKENEQHEESNNGKKKKPLKPQKLKKVDTKVPKIKQSILKLKKEKILKVSKDLRKTKIAKRVRKYSLNQHASSVKTLQSICIDFLNTSTYRNHAREQLSISRKFSKMKVLNDFKKKFNFDSMKKPNPLVNQKSNHSVQVNSLREMCGRLLVDKSKLLELDGSEEEMYQTHHEIPTLKELCKDILSSMNVSVVDLFTPPSLVDICENYIYNNRQYFHIEEVSSIPKLQDMCKDVLSASNIFINVENNGDSSIYTLNEAIESSEVNADGEPIYIVEENSGNVSELFESDKLNPQEKSEILKKIQHVANIDDEDEIFRAIGALHDDDYNNNSNVYGKEFSISDDMSYMPYITSDELFQSNVQYEEIISVNNSSEGKIKKVYEILRHKYLNRSDVRQATRTINRIMRKCLNYQRVHRLRNAQRKERINLLIQQARCALNKLRKLSCDMNIENDAASPHSSSSTSSLSSSSSSSSSNSSSSSSSSSSYSSSSSSIEEIEKQETIKEIESEIAAKNYENIIKVPNNYEESPESLPKPLINRNLNSRMETQNFPKLPTIFPSINEYKIERKGINRSVSSQQNNKINNDNDKELSNRYNSNNSVMRKRKMSFDESLLNINKMYRKKSENSDVSTHVRHFYQSDRRPSASSSSSSSRNHSSRNHSYDDKYYNDRHRRHRSRSKSRNRHHYDQRDDKSSSRRYHHSSSRHDYYRKDQNNKHSEARRLVLPSYKIYDKDLDVKLKVRPIVRIEREEKVDDMVKKYN